MSQASPIATDRSATSEHRRSGIPARLGRILLGLFLVFGAYTKFYFNGGWHFRDYNFFFAMAISSSRILPFGMAEWLAHVMPWLELILGALLIGGVGTRWVSLAACASIGFMASMPRAGMLGIAGRMNPAAELLADTGFFLVALTIARSAFHAHRGSRHQP